MVTEAQKRAKEKYMSSEKGKKGQKRWLKNIVHLEKVSITSRGYENAKKWGVR